MMVPPSPALSPQGGKGLWRLGGVVRRCLLGALVLLLALGWFPARAAAPPLTPPQEARALRLGDTLRCPVCRGLPITESPNELSAQMLREVREQVAAGRSDDQIYAYFAARFGENVLLNPPKRGLNLALWTLPALALAFGAFLLARFLRGASKPQEEAPSAELLARVERDLQEGRP